MITFACPGCQASFRLPDELAGKAARCSKCSMQFTVPLRAAPQAASPAASSPEPVVAAAPVLQKKVALNPVPALQAEVLDDEPLAATAAPATVPDDLEVVDEPARRPRRARRVYQEDGDRWDDDDPDRPRRPKRRRAEALGVILATTGSIAFGLMLMFLVMMLVVGGGSTLLAETNQLNNGDPVDRVLAGRRAKIYRMQLEAGKVYRIDLESRDFDAFLRIEQPEGIQIALDDDGGEGLNSRLFFRPQLTAQYLVIATTLDGRLGTYRLTVREQ